jgi:hypothetical protein
MDDGSVTARTRAWERWVLLILLVAVHASFNKLLSQESPRTSLTAEQVLLQAKANRWYIRANLYEGRQIQGSVRSVRSDLFQIDSIEIPLERIQSIDRRITQRKEVTRGTMIGASAGLGLSALLVLATCERGCLDDHSVKLVASYTGLGAVLGAFLGGMSAKHDWLKVWAN